MADTPRVPIGLWSELGPGARWTNEGVSRVVGFLIEGAATGGKYIFHLVVQPELAAEVRADLRTLKAVEGRDWALWSPEDPRELDAGLKAKPFPSMEAEWRAIAGLADYANRNVPVRAWVVTFPKFSGALLLDKPKAVLFPDALPYDFPLGWPGDIHWGEGGAWVRWRDVATKVLEDSDAVITFSEHVAQRHVVELCGIDRSKVTVVPLAPPDLSGLIGLGDDRRRSAQSRAAAAETLRAYMRDKGIDYLRDFPFEEVEFVAAATQDRPTKNLGLTADAVLRAVRQYRHPMKVLMTAPLHFGADWTRLPQVVEQHQFQRDLISLPDLPREVHAALFHCASIIVHSSFYEGIIGALPFYEAASVGTPAVLANGPHIEELLKDEPTLRPFVYDPYDPDALAELIRRIGDDRDSAVEAQAAIFDRLNRRGWDSVAADYAVAALSGEKRSSRVQ
ncbi:glycosyltransferase family 4 protein [Sphingomonas sinipercae]|uniref:Glycosyltransferase family 4 protein n=1 Tax=Sphingomonas sinipercae TaxID=2714944 RepID=A0A6G7ZKL1_9SPHN|nr:glycosyltransferase [Sphingomonas sinipercae]QIL01455.1 glycosyltransferase family 4 protein [Sphingomonas sinipercae]